MTVTFKYKPGDKHWILAAGRPEAMTILRGGAQYDKDGISIYYIYRYEGQHMSTDEKHVCPTMEALRDKMFPPTNEPEQTK